MEKPDTRYTGRPRRRSGPSDRRAGVFEHRPTPSIPMAADHPAIVNRTTRYPSTVKTPGDAPLLKPGQFARKLGRQIKVGPWKDADIYSLTLVERRTCPAHCDQWHTCYGNNMHRSHRFDPLGDSRRFMELLEDEIYALPWWDTGKVAIRLHILGDFFSLGYVAFWHRMLRECPGLHLFGFTSHPDPYIGNRGADRRSVALGKGVKMLNNHFPQRCVIRFSNSLQPDGAVVAPAGSDEPGDLIHGAYGFRCASELPNGADGCDTCGLCWHPRHRDKAVIFTDHGAPRTGRPKA